MTKLFLTGVAALSVLSTSARADDGWKFLVEFPPDKRDQCGKPPCYHGVFMGGLKATREQCEQARPYFEKEGFEVGPSVPMDQLQFGEEKLK